MPLDHLGKRFIGGQPLPLQRRLPILKKLPCPSLFLIIPELTKRFLQKIGGVQPLVCSQQLPQRLAPVQSQVFPVGEQRVFLPLDVSAFLAAQPGVFTLSDFVERLSQMTQNMELVEENGRLRGMFRLEGGGYGRPSTCPSRPVESACSSWVPATDRTDPCSLLNDPSLQTRPAADGLSR